MRHNLSVREEQILSLICEGWSRYEIAGMMCKSQWTIANHLKSIRDKTGCHKVALLVLWAVKYGIVDPHKASLPRASLFLKTRQEGEKRQVRGNISFLG